MMLFLSLLPIGVVRGRHAVVDALAAATPPADAALGGNGPWVYIRVEDTVAVTDTGVEVLTGDAPLHGQSVLRAFILAMDLEGDELLGTRRDGRLAFVAGQPTGFETSDDGHLCALQVAHGDRGQT